MLAGPIRQATLETEASLSGTERQREPGSRHRGARRLWVGRCQAPSLRGNGNRPTARGTAARCPRDSQLDLGPALRSAPH